MRTYVVSRLPKLDNGWWSYVTLINTHKTSIADVELRVKDHLSGTVLNTITDQISADSAIEFMDTELIPLTHSNSVRIEIDAADNVVVDGFFCTEGNTTSLPCKVVDITDHLGK